MRRLIPSVIIFVAMAVGLHGQTTGGNIDGFSRIKRELREQLRWEVLWTDAERTGMRIPSSGSAALAVYLTPKLLFYCSHDLGKCEEYGIEELHLRDRNKSTFCGSGSLACKEGQDDRDSLMAFVHQIDPALPILWPPRLPQGGLTLGGTITGVPDRAGVTIWTMSADLGTRAEIEEHYRQSRPAELSSLEEWFRTTTLPSAGYRSIMIPCFAMTDHPVIYTYGDRAALGPIMIAIKWDSEAERWEQAGMIPFLWRAPTAEEQKVIEGYHKTIESIKCATVEFK